MKEPDYIFRKAPLVVGDSLVENWCRLHDGHSANTAALRQGGGAPAVRPMTPNVRAIDPAQ